MSDRPAVSVESDDVEDTGIDEIQSVKALREFDKGPLKELADRWRKIESLAEELNVRVFPNDVGDFLHIFDDENNSSTHTGNLDETLGYLLGLTMMADGNLLQGQDQIKGFFNALRSKGYNPHKKPERTTQSEFDDTIDDDDVPF